MQTASFGSDYLHKVFRVQHIKHTESWKWNTLPFHSSIHFWSVIFSLFSVQPTLSLMEWTSYHVGTHWIEWALKQLPELQPPSFLQRVAGDLWKTPGNLEKTDAPIKTQRYYSKEINNAFFFMVLKKKFHYLIWRREELKNQRKEVFHFILVFFKSLFNTVKKSWWIYLTDL